MAKSPLSGDWYNPGNEAAIRYQCGYCDAIVGSRSAYWVQQHAGLYRIRICPNCNRPTFFEGNEQTPGVAFGESVGNLPEVIRALYDEARRCTSIAAYTSAVLASRKILMHVGVEKGAPENQNFIEYVNYLVGKGYVPPDGQGWVDHIRKKSNEANHEIKIMDSATAQELVVFVEMLLRFIYDLPARVPKPVAS